MKNFIKNYRPTIFFTSLFAIAIVTFIVIDTFFKNSLTPFGKDLLVEAHGVLGDLVLFGIVLSIYDTYRDLKEKKNDKLNLANRYREEIEDYQNWDSEEATVRIKGLISRLDKLGTVAMDLNFIRLKDVLIFRKTFNHASFLSSDLSYSGFYNCSFENCIFQYTDLSHSIFSDCEMSDNIFDSAILDGLGVPNKDFLDNCIDNKHIVISKYALISCSEFKKVVKNTTFFTDIDTQPRGKKIYYYENDSYKDYYFFIPKKYLYALSEN